MKKNELVSFLKCYILLNIMKYYKQPIYITNTEGEAGLMITKLIGRGGTVESGSGRYVSFR